MQNFSNNSQIVFEKLKSQVCQHNNCVSRVKRRQERMKYSYIRENPDVDAFQGYTNT